MTDWTVPRTWTDGEVVGAVTANIHWRDNLTHLKNPPYAEIVTGITGQSRVTATASTAIPLTAGVSATLQTYGGNVQAFLRVRLTSNLAIGVIMNLDYNGTAYSTQPSGIGGYLNNRNDFISYHVWITGLASGTYTFTPTWQQLGGNAMGFEASSSPLVFWVKEG